MSELSKPLYCLLSGDKANISIGQLWIYKAGQYDTRIIFVEQADDENGNHGKIVRKYKKLNMKNNQNAGTFFFGIIAVILGVALFKKFDFENLTYPKPWLGVVYLVTFLASVYLLFKSRSKQ